MKFLLIFCFSILTTVQAQGLRSIEKKPQTLNSTPKTFLSFKKVKDGGLAIKYCQKISNKDLFHCQYLGQNQQEFAPEILKDLDLEKGIGQQQNLDELVFFSHYKGHQKLRDIAKQIDQGNITHNQAAAKL